MAPHSGVIKPPGGSTQMVWVIIVSLNRLLPGCATSPRTSGVLATKGVRVDLDVLTRRGLNMLLF